MLRKILYEDGVIDQDEANFLFELNDAVSGKNNDPSWKTLVVEAISSFLLDDEKSPGEIDSDEAEWLISKIQGDGTVDDVEKALLIDIRSKAKKISPAMTDFINKNL